MSVDINEQWATPAGAERACAEGAGALLDHLTVLAENQVRRSLCRKTKKKSLKIFAAIQQSKNIVGSFEFS